MLSKPLILPSFHWELILCARMQLGRFSPMLSWSKVVGMGVGRESASLCWTNIYTLSLMWSWKSHELKNQYLIFQKLQWQNLRMKDMGNIHSESGILIWVCRTAKGHIKHCGVFFVSFSCFYGLTPWYCLVQCKYCL